MLNGYRSFLDQPTAILEATQRAAAALTLLSLLETEEKEAATQEAKEGHKNGGK